MTKLNPNVEEDDEILTIADSQGNTIDFIDIARIKIKNKTYAILQPVELEEGMEDDEAFVFEIVEKDGEYSLDIVIDDGIIDAVFAEYNKLLDEQA